MLEIKNLTVKLEENGKVILDNFNLSVPAGEIHCLMGANGAGKSTLGSVLSGKDGYDVEGEILLNSVDLLELDPEERAAQGLFMAFQYPVEVPGVKMMIMLQEAMNALRKARDQEELTGPEVLKRARQACSDLGISDSMLRRSVNSGFSGGEKKRNEMLQMLLLNPSFCVLDETDSGLDVDALKIVAQTINAMRTPDRSFLLITHYQRFLDYLAPDRIHVMQAGAIQRSGGPELAKQIDEQGYQSLLGQ